LPPDAPRSKNLPNRSCDAGGKKLRHPPLSHNLPNSNPRYQSAPHLRLAVRAAWGLWGICLIGGFLVATQLAPDPRGLGTHQQLGLPACTVREVFGVPCPSCGMTTSIAHFVRGQFLKSAQANAAGLWLAVCCLVQIPWSLKIAVTGRSPFVFSFTAILIGLLLSVTLISLIQWAVRLAF
jgi:hypothetical protein